MDEESKKEECEREERRGEERKDIPMTQASELERKAD